MPSPDPLKAAAELSGPAEHRPGEPAEPAGPAGEALGDAGGGGAEAQGDA